MKIFHNILKRLIMLKWLIMLIQNNHLLFNQLNIQSFKIIMFIISFHIILIIIKLLKMLFLYQDYLLNFMLCYFYYLWFYLFPISIIKFIIYLNSQIFILYLLNKDLIKLIDMNLFFILFQIKILINLNFKTHQKIY